MHRTYTELCIFCNVNVIIYYVSCTIIQGMKENLTIAYKFGCTFCKV